jgi:hypothetical protein
MKLQLYGKGIRKTFSGHLQYMSPMSVRGKYVHRVMVERMIEETPYSLRLFIPFPFEVHHIDYNKEHNCGCNFLLLSEAFHAKLTSDRKRDDGGRFGRKFIPRWKPAPPQWELPLYDDSDVPF